MVRADRRDPNEEPDHKRGLLRRKHVAIAADVPPALVDVPVNLLKLPITEFGNMTRSDAQRLAAGIAEAAAGWAVPTVWFAGGGALEFPGDRSVWARLDGDLDALAAIARGVTGCVEKLGFFVDRRLFRPMLSVATVTESTVGPDLDAVVGALQAFRGQSWRVQEIQLTTDVFSDSGEAELRVFEQIPVGPV